MMGSFIMGIKLCVYIDGANFFGCLNNFDKFYFDLYFDFERYIKDITGKNNLIKVYYYNGYLKKKINPKVWVRQDKLFNRLRKLKNWNVVLCRKQECYDEDGKKFFRLKEDDINLAINALSDAYENKYNKMILISSDRDFIPLIRKIKKIGKDVEVCYFENAISKKLLDLFEDKNKRKITKNVIKRYFFIDKNANSKKY
jgi:uncharacterized LabA/DUF88 family protein